MQVHNCITLQHSTSFYNQVKGLQARGQGWVAEKKAKKRGSAAKINKDKASRGESKELVLLEKMATKTKKMV